jgi:hypothetical protein
MQLSFWQALDGLSAVGKRSGGLADLRNAEGSSTKGVAWGKKQAEGVGVVNPPPFEDWLMESNSSFKNWALPLLLVRASNKSASCVTSLSPRKAISNSETTSDSLSRQLSISSPIVAKTRTLRFGLSKKGLPKRIGSATIRETLSGDGHGSGGSVGEGAFGLIIDIPYVNEHLFDQSWYWLTISTN